jgi:hypothetical protein
MGRLHPMCKLGDAWFQGSCACMGAVAAAEAAAGPWDLCHLTKAPPTLGSHREPVAGHVPVTRAGLYCLHARALRAARAGLLTAQRSRRPKP